MNVKRYSKQLIRFGLLATLLFAAVALAPAGPAYAATFTVDSTADADDANPGDGACDDGSGNCTLRAAISEANGLSGADTITLPAGTYTLSITGAGEDANASGDLDVSDDLTINGVDAATTIIDGNATDRVLHILSGIVTLNDITIQNGLTRSGADGSDCYDDCWGYDGEPGEAGGGVYNSGTLTVNGIIVSNNQTGAGGRGGDIQSCSSDYAICVTYGGAGGAGAGIYTVGDLTVNASAIRNNQSGNGGDAGDILSCSGMYADCMTRSGDGGQGAGIANTVTLNMENSLITSNQTGSAGAAGSNSCDWTSDCSSYAGDGGNGGGVAGGTLTIVNTTFSSNTAHEGGAVQQGNAISIFASRFDSNTAMWAGGAVNCNSGSYNCSISSSIFNGNSVLGGYGGGAIAFFNGGVKSVTNSTISGNASTVGGGGIRAFTGQLNLSFVTIANNTADSDNNGSGDGGGIEQTNPTVNLQNSIIADNVDMGGEAPDCVGTLTSQDYNHIEDVTGCTFSSSPGDTTGSDPGLVALADNGGPTLAHALGAGSPAIDQIPDGTNECGTTYTNDQRGAARPYNSACDKGAYEVRESITVGACGGTALNGAQSFNFTASGNSVTVDVDSGDGIGCIMVEEMGPGMDHLLATGPGASDDALLTNNWWHITGDVTSGFSVAITLPYADADADSRACKWPGDLGGHGWECGDGSNTWSGSGTVTRTGIASFSDWAVGDNVGPTAVSLQTLSAQEANAGGALLYGALTLLAIGFVFWLRRRYR